MSRRGGHPRKHSPSGTLLTLDPVGTDRTAPLPSSHFRGHIFQEQKHCSQLGLQAHLLFLFSAQSCSTLCAQPPFLSPGPWSLGLQPLLPSALGGEELGAGSTFQPHDSPRNPRVRAPRPFLSRTQASPPPLLWPQLESSPLGVKGAGPLVAMVPDCLGLLSDPWGLPRVCGEGEGGPDLGEVLRQPFPRVRPAGPGSPRLHRGPVR